MIRFALKYEHIKKKMIDMIKIIITHMMAKNKIFFVISETLYLERLAKHLIEKYDIVIDDFTEDDLNMFLEKKFEEEDIDTIQEYADMAEEHKLLMYYIHSGNDMIDFNLSKKQILSQIIRYPIVTAIYYLEK